MTPISAWAIAAGVLGFACSAIAQSFPAKSMRIIVPVAPGGGLDPQARLLGKKFQESMGQTVVVENRPSASTMIGTEWVVRAPADGYTLSIEIANAIKAPDAREFMAKEGAEPVGSSPQDFAAFFKMEIDRYAQVIKAANIRVE